VLPAAATVNDNIAMQFDFRRIYFSILKDWFGAPLVEASDALKTPLYAGGQGLPIIKSSAVLAADGQRETPTEFRLEQNYPNPFNPTTVVSCQLPVASEVKLTVYDIAGREVATLANGRYPAGRYEFTFDARGLASGTYLARLTAGMYAETKRMALVR